MSDFRPKQYSAEDHARLKAAWATLERNYNLTGELPKGVARMGRAFGMGAAGDARPQFPIIAAVDGVDKAAVLEQLPEAVRWAVDQTFRAVEQMQLPAKRQAGVQVLATRPGQLDVAGANALTRFDPFDTELNGMIFLTPLQGG